MISGDSADTPVERIFASGVMPSSCAFRSDMITSAAAPSLSGQQLPAVTVPSSRKTGSRVASFSTVTPCRGPSSAPTSPSAVFTGVISRAQNPEAIDSTARL